MLKVLNNDIPTTYFLANNDICSIPLTNSNKVCYIDTADYETVSKKKWYINQGGYIVSTKRKDNHIKLHRFLLNPNNIEIVHHINENKLDNRRCNLLLLTCSEHNRLHNNGKKRSQDTIHKFRLSSFRKKGIFKEYHGFELNKKSLNAFRVRIRHNKSRISLGAFSDPISAQIVYDFVINEIHGV